MMSGDDDGSDDANVNGDGDKDDLEQKRDYCADNLFDGRSH